MRGSAFLNWSTLSLVASHVFQLLISLPSFCNSLLKRPDASSIASTWRSANLPIFQPSHISSHCCTMPQLFSSSTMSDSIAAMSLYTGWSRPNSSTPPFILSSESLPSLTSFFQPSISANAFSMVREGSKGPSAMKRLRCAPTFSLKSSRPCIKLPFIFSLFRLSMRSESLSIVLNFWKSPARFSTCSFSSSVGCTSNFSSSLKWSYRGSNRCEMVSVSSLSVLTSLMLLASCSRSLGT
mmetsp:Transcript_27988/g.68420  ORF Transcript_27988/g.68420 Transcript_27988/m.68420 type:complete len:239 (-) Transcript_27988:3320-4036(-)